MTIEEIFFADIIKLMPYGTTCYLQVPDLRNISLLELLEDTEFQYYKSIELNEANKNRLINTISNENVIETVQSIEIKSDEGLLFEGYDGMEYGIMSNKIILPNEFIKKFVEQEQMCRISKEW